MKFFKADTELDDLIWRYYSNSFEYSWHMENPHHHDAVEFIYVAEGSCRLNFSNNVINPSKNEIIVVSSNSVHSCEITDKKGCTLINLHLKLRNNLDSSTSEKDFYNGFFQTVLTENNFIRFFNSVSIRPVIKNIAIELEEKRPYFETLVINEIERMIILLCRKFNNRADMSLHTDSSDYVQRAVWFIENSINKDLNAGRIAAAIHISPDYLMHLFKEDTGTALMEFVRRKKIDFARVLLGTTEMKVIDIAAETGFTNAQHFSTVFKKYSDGKTPGQYRADSRQLNNSDKNIFR